MLLIYVITFLISYLLMKLNLNIFASGLMVALAIFLYINDLKKTKNFINTRGLFAFGFIFALGLSFLKLSNLSNEYSDMFYLVCFSTYFCYFLGYYYSEQKNIVALEKIVETSNNKENTNKFLKIIMIGLMIITFIAFLIEAIVLGFVPAFTIDMPHAYSSFHIFMLHYITTLFVYLPSLVTAYFCKSDKRIENMNDKIVLASAVFYTFLMSILLVSRAELINSILLAIFVYTYYNYKYEKINLDSIKKFFNKKNIVIMSIIFFILIVFYILITVLRAHSTDYLYDIFEMKIKLPLFITQPYMYIAHNFENLNYMIKEIVVHSLGKRTLEPLWTITFIKKIFPFSVMTIALKIKEELTNAPIIYDAYYDFSLFGVIVFSLVLGYISQIIESITKCKKNNIFIVIIFAQFSYYMLFSFFYSYFSVTATYINLTFLFILYKIYNIILNKDN